MKNNLLFQAIISIVLFFLLWFGFSQIDFIGVFDITNKTTKFENEIGTIIWNQMDVEENVITNDSIVKVLDKLIEPICSANDIERDSLKVHIIKKEEVNAFALPNNHLVVYTGLIVECKNQEALQGVLGHEIAHIQNNHVMKKLTKEFGLSAILSTVTGGKGGETMRSILKNLSSTAYDRALEKEADLAGINYLIRAKINPEPLTDFMYELAQSSDTPNYLEWISTHPNSEERAKYILDFIKNKKKLNKQTLTKKQWESYKKALKNY